MTSYAALRESHNNRPWYQWITNHAQYTAERDSMHALRGMILVLTGYCKETFDREYNEYRAELAAKSEENIQEPKEAVSDDKRIKFSVNDIDKINEKDNSIKIEEKHEELNKSIPIPDDSYISNF